MKSEIAKLSKDQEYRYLMDSIDVSVSKHLLDEHFTLVAANERYYEMFGYTKEEYEDRFHNRVDLYYKDDPEDWDALSRTVLETITSGKQGYDCIGRMRHKDGSRLWIRLIGTFIDEYLDGSQISYSVMMDITELMQTKIEKSVTEDYFPGLISKYKVTEKGFEFIEGNANFYQFFNGRRSFNLDEIKEDIGLQNLESLYPSLRVGDDSSFIISPYDADGKKQYFGISAHCVDWNDDDPIYLLIYNNITELTYQKKQLEAYNETLHNLAFSDDVTGGFNRKKFDMVAEEIIRTSASGTYQMIWMNMQKFKLVNDMSGVELGDRLLEYIYHKIRDILSETEYAARLFSDNFIILMKNEGKEKTVLRLKGLVESINSYNFEQPYKYYLTFIFGIYEISENDLPIIYAEDRAHTAIESKDFVNTGFCTCSYYSEELRNKMLAEKSMENRMRDALKNGEFKLYLQPKYDSHRGTVSGAEALVRWEDPVKGLLPPAVFIPLFEANGFIIQIDLYIFEQTCRFLRKLIDEDKMLIPVSVNMSRAHFQDPDFLDHYIEIVERYDVPPEYLDIELTETMVFEKPEVFINIIKQIHAAGFKCSMDDFGSGYSSLNNLKDLDVDTLKLDRAFFSSRTMEDERENIIITNILNMSRALVMTTVAEGIETKEQVEFLKKTSCDMIQGFVFSKPVPASDFYDLLRHGTLCS